MANPARTKKRQVVDFDPEVDPAVDVAAAFDRLSVSAYSTVGKASSAQSLPTCCTQHLEPQSSTRPPINMQMSPPPTVMLWRHKEVVSALDDAISQMQSVAKKLKALAGDEIVDEPFSGKDISGNFAMWSIYELAQSLEESAYQFQLVQDGSSPPLSEYFYGDESDDDARMSGGEWALEHVNYEEIRDHRRK